MKNYIADGEVYPFTCTAATKSGDVIVMSATVAVAKSDGAIGELIATQAKGVVRLPKAAGVVIAQGALVYWNVAGKLVTVTNTDLLLGRAYEAAGNGPVAVNVDLNV